MGKIAILDGDPGLGKSTLALTMGAHVTTATEWPDGHPCPHGGAVIISAEDDAADTICPRLHAAGANLSRIVLLDTVGDDRHPIMLPGDLGWLEAAIDRVQAKLVVIDPLMAMLDAKYNSYRDQDIRQALRPLADMAPRKRVAVLVIRHLNKLSGGSAMYRGGGSIAIVGAARVGLLVAPDPDDPERRILASVKTNLSKKAVSLAYRLEDADGTARLRWEGTSTLTADQLVKPPTDDDDALGFAKGFLREMLADGPIADGLREGGRRRD